MLSLHPISLLAAILVTAFASAIAGRLVDFSAVWFLFHPYKKINLPLIKELGVLPRRQEALADQVALLIEERLITQEGISEFLTSEQMAGQVRQTVSQALKDAANREYPSVRDMLAGETGATEPIDREIRVLVDWIGDRAAALLRQPDFQARVASLVGEVLEQRRGWPLEELMPPGLFEAFEQYLATRWDVLADNAAGVAAEVDSYLANLGLVTDFLPHETLEWARSYIKDNLPEWFAVAEALLQEPQVKAAFKTYVLDILERVAASNPNLFSFEGLLGAWRQLFPEDFSRRLEGFIDVTVPKLRKALEDPQTREFVAKRVDMWMDEVATTPLGVFYGRLPKRARKQISEGINLALSSPDIRRSALWVVGRVLMRARRARLEEVLPAGVFEREPGAGRSGGPSGAAEPPRDWIDRAVRYLGESLAQEPAQGALKHWVERGVSRLLAIPIGVPSRVLGAARLAQIEDVAVGQVLALLENHAHQIAQAIDLKDMVRERIRAADPRAIEEVVKGRLAKREFNTIFLIGLMFGGLVGLVATAFFHWCAVVGSWPAVLAAGTAIILIMLRIVRV